jgi:hypothetical protein
MWYDRSKLKLDGNAKRDVPNPVEMPYRARTIVIPLEHPMFRVQNDQVDQNSSVQEYVNEVKGVVEVPRFRTVEIVYRGTG